VAAGADGLIVEVHPDPDRALCDGPQSLPTAGFAAYADEVHAFARAIRGTELALAA
jgi:3-deoxy-7-phosphoheptulonate synthase